jgi:hypothetical protein
VALMTAFLAPWLFSLKAVPGERGVRSSPVTADSTLIRADMSDTHADQ